MKIGIDMDGVLAEFNTDYVELLEEVSGTKTFQDIYNGWEPSEWNYEHTLGFTPQDVNEAWRRIGESDSFWFNLAPLYPELNLKGLHESNDLYFITARPGATAKQQSERWIQMVYDFPGTVVMSSNKGPLAAGIGLDLFIDDRAENIWSVKGSSPGTQCFVLDHPYNRHIVPAMATRIRDLKEVICDGHIARLGC